MRERVGMEKTGKTCKCGMYDVSSWNAFRVSIPRERSKRGGRTDKVINDGQAIANYHPFMSRNVKFR